MKTLVIGCGNPAREDDGAGFVAAERLNGIAVHQFTPELSEDVATAERVVFIDADSSLAPGTWQVSAVDAASESATAHSCTPATLMALATILYGHAPQAILIRIGTERLGHGSELSPSVAEAVDAVIAHVCEYSSAG